MPYYPPGQQRPQKDPPPKKVVLFRLILLCLSCLLISYGACRLIGYGADWLSSRRTAQELRQAASETEPAPEAMPELTSEPTSEPTPEPSPAPTAEPAETPAAAPEKAPVLSDELPAISYPNGLQVNARIRNLRKKSEYIFGWLTMDDLDEPVALKDNVFFLDHDATGKRNGNGSLFLDEDTRLMTRPYSFLIYGHNMKTGAMFGNLKKYEQTAYCNQHRILRFDTLYEEGQYAIFAVATIRLTPGTAGYLSLADLQSARRKPRQKALGTLSALSVYNNILDVNEEDQLLLLITCVGEDDQRLVVAARRLREKETPETLTMKNRQ